MNQDIQIVNLTKGVISLAGKHQILPRKSITLSVIEYNPILSKINLFKSLGWLDFKFIPVNLNREVSSQKISSTEFTQEIVVESATSLDKISTPVVEEKTSESHPASPLISRKWKRLFRQEGDLKTDDSKRIV